MPPRRGGGNAARALPEPPVRRMVPFSRNGANTTDIVAGRFDNGGAFEGMVLSEVNLGALQRFFSLGPVHLPKELRGLAEEGKEAYPIYVVTRGSYGRARDSMPGPIRNGAQAHVWQKVRQIRAEMPSMRIICVDIPTCANISLVSNCMSPELSMYDELALFEGAWFTPDVVQMPKLAQQLREIEKRDMPTDSGVSFKRASFNWRALPGDDEVFLQHWKKVMDEPNFLPPKLPE
mmetsp:Transcript_24284/g.44581  ORF Transcript_24284/g.44581 Transcript_24284/m.44581 type:complete len:234 (-) Transcript_24284:79-780(-)